MEIKDIKTPFQVYDYMKENIRYGWVDINDKKHIQSMEDFKTLYKTMTLEEILKYKLGTCIDQVYLTHILLDKINVPNKMYCTRISNEVNEHLHCFILFEYNDMIAQIETANRMMSGVFPFEDELTAVENINRYYTRKSGMKTRSIIEFYDVKPGMSFEEFNSYLDELDKEKESKQNVI